MGLSNRKKKDFNLEDSQSLYKPVYDYSSLVMDDSDKGILITLEKDILHRGKVLGEIAYKIGEALEKAKGIFKKYSTIEGDPESFVGWYRSFGLSPDQVYLFRGRYRLSLEHPEHTENIITLSEVAIKETINKKTPEELREKVILGEITSGSAIKKARAEIIESQKSRDLEKVRDDIIEAEIVETEEEITQRLLAEAKFLERDIRERERNLKLQKAKLKDICAKLENRNNLKLPE